MGKIWTLLIPPLLAGCLTSTPPEIREWSVGYGAVEKAAAKPAFGVARIAHVVVRAPYDVRALHVLRADGTVATDPYNRFAALPSQLLKGPTLDALRACGAFEGAVGPSSAAATAAIVEVSVSRFALDCRKGGLEASVALSLMVLDRERTISALVDGEGSADAAAGDFTKAFSAAFSAAVESALKRL